MSVYDNLYPGVRILCLTRMRLVQNRKHLAINRKPTLQYMVSVVWCQCYGHGVCRLVSVLRSQCVSSGVSATVTVCVVWCIGWPVSGTDCLYITVAYILPWTRLIHTALCKPRLVVAVCVIPTLHCIVASPSNKWAAVAPPKAHSLYTVAS